MADYADNISPADYRESQPVYVTNVTDQDQYNVALRFDLNESNFHFPSARYDGSDLRLAEASNGSGVLNMWIASWNQEIRQATVWFKLPRLLPSETRTLYAFWGNYYAASVSDLDILTTSSGNDGIFVFSDDFPGATLDTSKWVINDGGTYTMTNSTIRLGRYDSIETVDPVLSSLTSWIMEEGQYFHTQSHYGNKLHEHQFSGGPNEFSIQYWDSGTARKHNFEYGGGLVDDYGEFKTIEVNSYALNYVAYNEGTDFVYQGMLNRFSYPDYNDSWERKVHRNTEIEKFKIVGKIGGSAQHALLIDWVVIREFTPDADPIIDISNLLIPYEDIGHQPLDFTEYTSDITSVDFFHSSDSGGDPYRLSDNVINSIANIFVADELSGGGEANTGDEYVEIYRVEGSYNQSTGQFSGPNFRYRIYAENLTNEVGDGIKLYFGPMGAVTSCYIGHPASAGDPWNFDGNQKQVTVVGSTSFDPSGYETASDLVEIDYDGTSDLIISLYVAGTSWPKYGGPDNSIIYRNGSATNEAGLTEVTGYSAPYPNTGDAAWFFRRMQVRTVAADAGSGNVIIDFGRSSDNIADNDFIHFDNNHVEFYGAAKLSDRETDVHGANYWQATTSSGVWAAIQFPAAMAVGCMAVQAVGDKLGGMIRNYEIYATNLDPRFSSETEWTLLAAGTFAQTTQEQTVYFDRGKFYYYILKAVDSFGDNVAVQEWRLHEAGSAFHKRAVAQFRLHPVTLANQEEYFVKEIRLYGSNDGVNWISLEGSAASFGGIIEDNIALNQLTTAATTQGGGNDTEKAVDGDDDTWYSTGASVAVGTWWYVDLGGEYVVGRLEILVKNGSEIYDVHSSTDAATWTPLAFNVVGSLSYSVFYPDERARYVRISFTASSNWGNWAEIYQVKVYAREADVSGATETYTPFYDATYGRWQRYSLANNDAYYLYRLNIANNWYASDDRIKIAEWEMVERVSEADNHRILFGTTDDISQIWADPTTTFDNGNIYALNDVLNTIYSDDSATYDTISGSVSDMNVII